MENHTPGRADKGSRPGLVYAVLTLHSLLSAGTFLFAKRALAEIPWPGLGLLRFCGTSVVMALLLLRLPPAQRLPPRAVWGKLLLLSIAVVPLNQCLFLFGLQLSTPAHAALLYTLTPLFVLLLAQALLGERPGLMVILGTALALAGAVRALTARGLSFSGGPMRGDLLLVGAVLAWAFFTAEGREVVARYGAFRMSAWALIGGTLLYLPFGGLWLVDEGHRAELARASGAAWLGLGYLILITSVVANTIWYWGLGRLPAARVAIFNNLQPLSTAALSHWLLGEAISLKFLLGAAAVIAGVLVAQWPRRAASLAAQTAASTPVPE